MCIIYVSYVIKGLRPYKGVTMKKLIKLGIGLYIAKFILLSVSGVYIPDVIILAILAYTFINDKGMMNDAKKIKEEFKKGFSEADNA